jgi:hypothetical protein
MLNLIYKQKHLVAFEETISDKPSVAEQSCPQRQYKEDVKANNKPQGCKQKHSKTGACNVNWKSPFLWSQIETAAVKAGKPWKPHDIVIEAKRLDPLAFTQLTEQVVGRWIDRDAKEEGIWKDSVLAEVENGNAPGGQSTRTGILVS